MGLKKVVKRAVKTVKGALHGNVKDLIKVGLAPMTAGGSLFVSKSNIKEFGQGSRNVFAGRRAKIHAKHAERETAAEQAKYDAEQKALLLDERKRKSAQRRAQINFGYNPTGGYSSEGVVGTVDNTLGG